MTSCWRPVAATTARFENQCDYVIHTSHSQTSIELLCSINVYFVNGVREGPALHHQQDIHYWLYLVHLYCLRLTITYFKGWTQILHLAYIQAAPRVARHQASELITKACLYFSHCSKRSQSTTLAIGSLSSLMANSSVVGCFSFSLI